MRYQAMPIEVKAFKIISVDKIIKADPPLLLKLTTEDNQERVATPEMQARYIPKIGDYWVIQSDGYEYLNPKDVFERKYIAIGV